MKGMKSAKEYYTPATPGRYPSLIVSADAGTSAKGNSMLTLICEITDGKFKGEQATDYIITDGGAKGGGLAKRKLRGIGTPAILQALDTDADIPDAVIAQELIGLNLIVEYGNEDQMAAPDYKTPNTIIDENGKTVTLQKLVVKGYSRHATAGTQLPAQQLQTQGQLPLQPQYAQQGLPQQQLQAPQYAQQGYAPQATQGQAGFQAQPYLPGQQLPQGFVPSMAQGVAPGNFPTNGAPPPWNGGQVAPGPTQPGR